MTSFSCWTTPCHFRAKITLVILCHWRCCCDFDVFVVVIAVIVVFDNVILFVDHHVSLLCKDLSSALLVGVVPEHVSFGSLGDNYLLYHQSSQWKMASGHLPRFWLI